MQQYLTTFHKLQHEHNEKVRNLRAEAFDNISVIFLNLLENTNYETVVIRAYRPYFNDGNECHYGFYIEFSTHEEEDGEYDERWSNPVMLEKERAEHPALAKIYEYMKTNIEFFEQVFEDLMFEYTRNIGLAYFEYDDHS